MSDIPPALQISPNSQLQMVGLVSSPEQLVEAKRFIDSAKARAFSMRPYPVCQIEDSERTDYDAAFASVASLTDEVSKVIPWLVSFTSPQEHQGLVELIYKICVFQEQRQHNQGTAQPAIYLFSLPELRGMYQLLEQYLRNVNQFLVHSGVSGSATQTG